MKISLNPGNLASSTVFTGGIPFSELEGFIVSECGHPKKIFILVDENTREHCLPILLSNTPCLRNSEILEIPAGEKSKTIEMATTLWGQLIGKQAGRDSLLICLGGGVITDLGGFTAALFKRGIRFIHIPTTLMGMVDAAIGGKTAVNLRNIKNPLGSFTMPEAVFTFSCFLKTLPAELLADGFSEIMKYGLIQDKALWSKVRTLMKHGFLKSPWDESVWETLICRCVELKCRIVNRDYRELNHRKILNFGHTIGHALESFSMLNGKYHASHGKAVAAGMICESYLSMRVSGLSADEHAGITRLILQFSGQFKISAGDIPALREFLEQDKKNRNGGFRFSLLTKIGNAVYDTPCSWEQVNEALSWYCSLNEL